MAFSSGKKKMSRWEGDINKIHTQKECGDELCTDNYHCTLIKAAKDDRKYAILLIAFANQTKTFSQEWWLEFCKNKPSVRVIRLRCASSQSFTQETCRTFNN